MLVLFLCFLDSLYYKFLVIYLFWFVHFILFIFFHFTFFFLFVLSMFIPYLCHHTLHTFTLPFLLPPPHLFLHATHAAKHLLTQASFHTCTIIRSLNLTSKHHSQRYTFYEQYKSSPTTTSSVQLKLKRKGKGGSLVDWFMIISKKCKKGRVYSPA